MRTKAIFSLAGFALFAAMSPTLQARGGCGGGGEAVFPVDPSAAQGPTAAPSAVRAAHAIPFLRGQCMDVQYTSTQPEDLLSTQELLRH
jgi:hypothetical protein